ncbi:CHAT domain-containing protein [Streptomyces zhihengii]
MSGKPYDLSAVMYEVQQMAGGLVTSGAEMDRASALIKERLGCRTAWEAFERLYADWRAIPEGTLHCGKHAGETIVLLTMLRLDAPLDIAQRDELLAAAKAYGPQGDDWQSAVLGAAASAVLLYPTEDRQRMESDLAILDEAARMSPPGSDHRAMLELQHAMTRANLAQLGGGEDEFDEALDDATRLADAVKMDPENRLFLDGQLAAFRVQQDIRRGDATALEAHIDVMETVVARLPHDHADLLRMEAYLDNARANLSLIRQQAGGGTPTRPIRRRSVDNVVDSANSVPAGARGPSLVVSGVGRGEAAMTGGDRQGVVEAIDLLGRGFDLLEPEDPHWLMCTGALGRFHVALARDEGTPSQLRPGHLDQGIAFLRHTLRMTRGPEHPQWGPAAMVQAMAHRMRAELEQRDGRRRDLDRSEACRLGLLSLTASGWAVLLQSGTAHGAETGRRAGAQALTVAAWCLADGHAEEAARALDAGRGLVLHAATVGSTVVDMLSAVGRTELADEWRREGAASAETGPSSRLRRRVLQALADSPYRQRLLEVPSPRETGAALRAMGRAALVYLVPSGDGQPGAALVVAPDGSVRAVPLPGLDVRAAELAGYRAAGAPGRDAGGPPAAGAAPPPRDASALARLCDWAGRVVMEPLLRELPRGWGRAASVVLVPMGELGVVPWHAARLPRSGRYACQEAEISYIPSARLLCEVAERPAAGARQAMVVGDPTRDLRHAGEEAEAVRRVFYPGGELLGPGAATPAAVKDWLGRQRGGVLHLACHGVVEQGGRHSSYLSLAGGRLPAEELTEGSDRYGGLELVVLAACRTNVSGHGFDEAYSLATAFLVAGARSVVGSMWPVPDEATSLLMYMVHHFSAREGMPPGQALRGAQLWMLDPGRGAPPGMPADMVARVGRIDADDLVGWAGFTHLGW